MALASVFQPAPAKTANLSGPFTPITAGGGGNAPGASPDATNAPDLTLASQTTGPVDAAIQGGKQAVSATNMPSLVGRGVGVPSESIFSDGLTPSAIAGTAGRGAIGLGMNAAIPGFTTLQGLTSLASLFGGALGGLATFFGQPGQQTTSELSGPIGEGLGMTGTGPGVMSSGGPNVSQGAGPTSLSQGLANSIALGVFGGRGGQDSTPDGPNASGGGTGAPGGPAGSGGNGTGAGGASGVGGAVGGGPGDAKGGTILNSRGTTRGTRDTVHKRLMPGEEVVRKSEADKPGVRPLLKEINQPGTGPVEQGLSRLFRKGGAHGMA